jgi:ketosteroid isomerase-like protein
MQILIAVALTLLAQAIPTDADTQSLLRLERVWNDAHLHGEAGALDRLWSDDLEVIVPKMPPMTKAQVLGFAKSGRMRSQQYETSDLKVRVYGDAAVVTGRLQRTRTVNDLPVTDDWRFIKVYARHRGSWEVVAFQASEAAAQ